MHYLVRHSVDDGGIMWSDTRLTTVGIIIVTFAMNGGTE